MTEQAIKIAQTIEYERIVRTHEKKAKAVLIKQKTAELIAEGVDEVTAGVMAKVFYEYEL